MSDQFLGEIRLFSFNFAPRDWAKCDGGMVSIGQNPDLAKLIGTTYGGDGRTTIQLPDLRGRTPVSASQDWPIGFPGGDVSVALNTAQMPAHTHEFLVATEGTGAGIDPGGAYLLSWGQTFIPPDPKLSYTTFADASVQPVGNNQPHDNMMPYVTINFCIALMGIYPSRQ